MKRKYSGRRKIYDVSEKKRYYSETTLENTKQCFYTDGDIIKTKIQWKLWASLRGYIVENLIGIRDGRFIIYYAWNNRIIKVLRKVEV